MSCTKIETTGSQARRVFSAPCPVKVIAETVELLIAAMDAADEEKALCRGSADIETRTKGLQAGHRSDALWELIHYKKEQAAVLQATSAGGAAHQVAIASELVGRIDECLPDVGKSLSADDHRRAQECHRLLQWTLYSILNVLISLEATPREKLGIEYYMAADISPFVRTALQQEAA